MLLLLTIKTNGKTKAKTVQNKNKAVQSFKQSFENNSILFSYFIYNFFAKGPTNKAVPIQKLTVQYFLSIPVLTKVIIKVIIRLIKKTL